MATGNWAAAIDNPSNWNGPDQTDSWQQDLANLLETQ
jgi:hypothetical protein